MLTPEFKHRELFETELKTYFENQATFGAAHGRLIEAMQYTMIQTSAKRFRPLLIERTLGSLEEDYKNFVHYALAIEMVHGFSLIHDDLPCMDDDDERRGQPTNHKVFGEDVALLAGDALLNASYEVLLQSYGLDKLKVLMVELVQATGVAGMIGGQAMDVGSITEAEHEKMLVLKTGALMKACIMGPVKVLGVDPKLQNIYSKISTTLGLCFQVADDIQDLGQDGDQAIAIEKPKLLFRLDDLTGRGVALCQKLKDPVPLTELFLWNKERA